VEDAAPPPVVDAPPPSVDGPPPDTAPPDLPDGDTFDRKYVEGLRDEAARYRVTAKEREEALGRYSFFEEVPDSARDLLLEMNEALVNDPEGAGPMQVVQFLRRLTGENFDKILEESKTPQYLTREDAERVAKEEADRRDQERLKAEANESLWRNVKDLGYEDGNPDTALLFWYANKETDGDLAKADEAVKSFRQAVIDSYVESKRTGNAAFPPVSGSRVEGPGLSPEESPKTLDQAGEMFRQLVKQQAS
jgi:hypothetical protein